MLAITRCSTLAVAGVVIASMVAPTAEATVAQSQLTLRQLTQYADMVVHGTVQSVSMEKEEGDRIYTYIDVALQEVMKGPRERREITVKLLGGTYEGIRMRVLGSPCMERRDEVVLFVKRMGDGTFDVTNLAEGKFQVRRDPGASPRLERDLSEVTYLQPGTPTDIPETLEAIKTAVRELVEGN